MPIRLTVIGGGPGGYTAAFAAARAGMSVTLVESGNLGGTCLNNGCIPTKTLVYEAHKSLCRGERSLRKRPPTIGAPSPARTK